MSLGEHEQIHVWHRCYGCGAKGDMVTFHMKRTGLAFVNAVRDLLGVRA